MIEYYDMIINLYKDQRLAAGIMCLDLRGVDVVIHGSHRLEFYSKPSEKNSDL